MSEKTQALEGNASRAMADALHAGTGNLVDNATRQACDTFVWELTASVIAKVQENLLSETTRLREILHAMPGETICGAANRWTFTS